MKSIKIAPDLNEIKVNGNTIAVEFNGLGINYTNDNVMLFRKEAARKAMQAAIGFSSNDRQVKYLLDEFFKGESNYKAIEL